MYKVPHYSEDPKRGHNFDSHPYYESVSISTSISIPPFNMDSQKGTLILAYMTTTQLAKNTGLTPPELGHN